MTIPHVCDLRPRTDHHTHRLLDQAIAHLARLRDLPDGHPAIRLHLTASLLQQGETALTTAATELTRHGYTDTQICILAGLG